MIENKITKTNAFTRSVRNNEGVSDSFNEAVNPLPDKSIADWFIASEMTTSPESAHINIGKNKIIRAIRKILGIKIGFRLNTFCIKAYSPSNVN